MGQTQTIIIPSHLFQMEKSETHFETAVTQAINDVLSALGAANKQAIYRHLKNHYGIDENEIPNQIEDFATAIEQIFGPVAKLLEIKIIEQLHGKYKDFAYSPEKAELDFSEFVNSLQEYLQLKPENSV